MRQGGDPRQALIPRLKAERSDHASSSNLGRAFFVVLSSAVDRLVVAFFGGGTVVAWALGAVLAGVVLGAGFAADVGVAVALAGLVGVVGSGLGAALALVPPGFAIVAFGGFAAASAVGASGLAGVVAFRPSIAGLTGLRVSMGALLATATVRFALGAAIVASAGMTFLGSTASLLATGGLVLGAVRSGVGAALATVRAGVVGTFDFARGLAATGVTGVVAGAAFAFGSAITGVGRGARVGAGSAFDVATRVALGFGVAIGVSAGMTGAGGVAAFDATLVRAAVGFGGGFAIVASAGITGVVSAFDATLARAGVAFGLGLAIVASAGMTGAGAAAALAAAVPLTFGRGVVIVASAGTTGVVAAAFAGVVAAALLVAGFAGGLTTADETFAVGLMIVALLGFVSGAADLASVAKAASATACLATAASRRRRSVLAGAAALPTASAGIVAPSRAPTGLRTVSSSEISAADVRRLHQNAAVVAGNPIPTMP